MKSDVIGIIKSFESNSKITIEKENGKLQWYIISNQLMWLHVGEKCRFEFNTKGLICFGEIIGNNMVPEILTK